MEIKEERILLTPATGTGKTFIAFPIAWKRFHTLWNLNRQGTDRPRIPFLAVRKVLGGGVFNIVCDFVLSHRLRDGVDELDQEELNPLLRLRYRNSRPNAVADLGRADEIGRTFAGFQR